MEEIEKLKTEMISYRNSLYEDYRGYLMGRTNTSFKNRMFLRFKFYDKDFKEKEADDFLLELVNEKALILMINTLYKTHDKNTKDQLLFGIKELIGSIIKIENKLSYKKILLSIRGILIKKEKSLLMNLIDSNKWKKFSEIIDNICLEELNRNDASYFDPMVSYEYLVLRNKVLEVRNELLETFMHGIDNNHQFKAYLSKRKSEINGLQGKSVTDLIVDCVHQIIIGNLVELFLLLEKEDIIIKTHVELMETCKILSDRNDDFEFTLYLAQDAINDLEPKNNDLKEYEIWKFTKEQIESAIQIEKNK